MGAELDTPGTFERVLSLKEIPAFADLHPADLTSLAERAVPRRLAPGVPLPVDAEGGSVHFLLEGRVAPRHEAPAVLGMLEVLADGTALELVTETEATTLEIDRRALLGVLEDEFEVWLALLRHVCARTLQKGAPPAVPHADASKAQPARRSADPADLAERIALLHRVEPFAGVGIHVLGQLASQMEPLEFAPGDALWQPGDAAGHVLAIMAGVVQCSDDEGGACELGAGSLLGLGEALCVDRRGYRAEARGVVRALRLDAEALIDVLEDDPDAAVELLCVIARGIGPCDDEGGDDDGNG